jgi:hypothetical protein
VTTDRTGEMIGPEPYLPFEPTSRSRVGPKHTPSGGSQPLRGRRIASNSICREARRPPDCHNRGHGILETADSKWKPVDFPNRNP